MSERTIGINMAATAEFVIHMESDIPTSMKANINLATGNHRIAQVQII